MNCLTENEKRARIFKSFCDANRLTILGLLKGGEKCACELLDELHIGQPTLSHHMKILATQELSGDVKRANGRIIPLTRKEYKKQKSCWTK